MDYEKTCIRNKRLVVIWINLCVVLHQTNPTGASGVDGGSPCGDVSDPAQGGAFRADDTWCYEFVPTKELWSVARDRCWNHGGRLVEVSEQAVKDFLVDQLRGMGWESDGMWTGLNDKREEGKWEWVAEQGEPPAPLTWSNWASHGWLLGLVGGFAEDCAYMDPRQDWRWKKVVCSLKLHKYICQYQVKAIPQIPEATTLEVRSSEELESKITEMATQFKKRTTSIPAIKLGHLIAERKPEETTRDSDLKVFTQNVNEALFNVGRKYTAINDTSLWLVALLVAVGVATLVSIFSIVSCVLITRSRRKRAPSVHNVLAQPPKDLWISNENAKRYVRADLGAKGESHVLSPGNAYTRKPQGTPDTEPSNGDDVYLHMGQNTDHGPRDGGLGPPLPVYPDEVSYDVPPPNGNYDVPVPNGKYSEIGDTGKNNIYETIDEIRRQLELLENSQ